MATFHASSASTGGASRLMRCAGPMSTPATLMKNAPAAASGTSQRCGRACRATGRNPGWRVRMRSITSAARAPTNASSAAPSPTRAAAVRLAHMRSASLHVSRRSSVVSIARAGDGNIACMDEHAARDAVLARARSMGRPLARTHLV